MASRMPRNLALSEASILGTINCAVSRASKKLSRWVKTTFEDASPQRSRLLPGSQIRRQYHHHMEIKRLISNYWPVRQQGQTPTDQRGYVHGIKRVDIIGAGPSGLTTAKYLSAEQKFDTIDVFERRSSTGGVWNTDVSSPRYDSQTYPSAVYEALESNIPGCVMQYFDTPFSKDCPLMPDACQVRDYLHEYGRDVRDRVKLQTEVINLEPHPADTGQQWEVTTRHVAKQTISKAIYDAVVIANGRYNKPYIPAIPGLKEWKAARPGTITHSSAFRSPSVFTSKKVLLVGHSSSGIDIADQVQEVCAPPLLISLRGNTASVTTPVEGKRFAQQVTDMDVSCGKITFQDGSHEDGVDAIVFCTGFDYEYPFLQNLSEFRGPADNGNTDTFQHIFWNPRPTLAFVLLPLLVVAFPFAESQAAVIARVWSGRLNLPPREERQRWTSANERKRGTGRSFHKMGYPADYDYQNDMYAWCMTASDPGKGKAPPLYDMDDRWHRSKVNDIRVAYQARGSLRSAAKTPEDVGFVREQVQSPRNN